MYANSPGDVGCGIGAGTRAGGAGSIGGGYSGGSASSTAPVAGVGAAAGAIAGAVATSAVGGTAASGAHSTVRRRIVALLEGLDRSPARCISTGHAGRLSQDATLAGYSPLEHVLSREAGSDGEPCWQLLQDAAEEDAGCGAAVACLLGLAIGDAVGHPLEFTPADESLPDASGCFADPARPCVLPGIHKERLQYSNPYNKFELRQGQWTDDTSMALCLADSLLVHGRYHGGDARVRWHMWWTHGYCNAFRNDTSRWSQNSVGLGGNVSKSMQEVEYAAAGHRNPIDLVSPIYVSSRNDSGNGTIMRLAPVPIACRLSVNQSMEVSAFQSLSTHPGAEAAACCCFMACFINLALDEHSNRKNPGADPHRFIDKVVNDFTTHFACGEVSKKAGMETFWLSAGDDHQASLDRLFALLRCEPPSPKEQNWHWKREELQLRGAITARRTGPHGYDHRATYNGHPISSEYFGAYCMDGLAMALWSLWHSRSFSQCIIRVVNLCGDADTTAAIAGQMAGAQFGWSGLLKDERGATDEWTVTCIQRLRRWDPLAEVGLRAVLLYHEFEARPEVEFRQVDGHPTVRAYRDPDARSPVVGELARGERAIVVAHHNDLCRVKNDRLDGWVGRKNTVYVSLRNYRGTSPVVLPRPGLGGGPGADRSGPQQEQGGWLSDTLAWLGGGSGS